MIDNDHGIVAVHCDSCADHVEGEKGESFQTVWAAAKTEGWRAFKVNDEWMHKCPACREK